MFSFFKRKNPSIETLQDSPPKRVLILGSLKHSSVKCANWDSQPFPNVADFDAVVVNTASLGSLLQTVCQNGNEQVWEKIKNNLEKVRTGLLAVLNTCGEIYTIAAPEVRVNFPCVARAMDKQRTNYWWCPLPLSIIPEEGETLKVEDASFRLYFEKVKKWQFYIQPLQSQNETAWLEEAYGGLFQARWSLQPIAKNRYERLLAAKFFFTLHRVVEHQRTLMRTERIALPEAEHTSGSLIVLPLPTEISDRGAINFILENVYHFPQQTLPPQWIEQLVVPGYYDCEDIKKKKQDEVDQISQEIFQVDREIAELNTFKQLLYESGQPLEEICKKTISTLGGIVKRAEVGQEDFIIEFEEERALTEVKGNNKSISLDDLRQLGHYLEDYEFNRGMKVKGILLGNAWRLLPLDQRKNAFPDNVINYARARDIALVNTIDLYRAYCDMLEQKTTGKDILRRILAGIGVTSL